MKDAWWSWASMKSCSRATATIPISITSNCWKKNWPGSEHEARRGGGAARYRRWDATRSGGLAQRSAYVQRLVWWRAHHVQPATTSSTATRVERYFLGGRCRRRRLRRYTNAEVAGQIWNHFAASHPGPRSNSPQRAPPRSLRRRAGASLP